jgi:hypothetical protein
MPVPLDLAPPPQFERSMISYVTTNFGRVRDALNRAWGGNYQTGTYTAVFAGVTAILVSISFPVVFASANGPLMEVTPINNPAGPDLHPFVTRASNSLFILRVESYSGALTGSYAIKWAAHYP